jgi:protein PsiE
MKIHKLDATINQAGGLAVAAFHYLALFAIGGAIVWSAGAAFIQMAIKGGATINDILLLFIYLELGAMVGIYFKTNHMPVRFLIYIAITALTRLLVEDISRNHRLDTGILVVASAILLLSVATLVIRYASAKFPSLATESDKGADK